MKNEQLKNRNEAREILNRFAKWVQSDRDHAPTSVTMFSLIDEFLGENEPTQSISEVENRKQLNWKDHELSKLAVYLEGGHDKYDTLNFIETQIQNILNRELQPRNEVIRDAILWTLNNKDKIIIKWSEDSASHPDLPDLSLGEFVWKEYLALKTKSEVTDKESQ
jgi:hypothetical protein